MDKANRAANIVLVCVALTAIGIPAFAILGTILVATIISVCEFFLSIRGG